MKNCLKFCVVVSVLLAVAPAMATLYSIDFKVGGDLQSGGITTADWGQYEPGPPTNGNYGGIVDGEARMVKGHSTSGDDNFYATITFPEDVASVTIGHLDGSLFDSFDVLVDNVYWGSYTGLNDGEFWVETTYTGTPGSVVTIDITNIGAASWVDVWGQLAIDYVEANTVPEPATLCLLGLGGLLLRRKR